MADLPGHLPGRRDQVAGNITRRVNGTNHVQRAEGVLYGVPNLVDPSAPPDLTSGPAR
jgi:hypothetical protein